MSIAEGDLTRGTKLHCRQFVSSAVRVFTRRGFLAFDLLHLNGEDLRSEPVEERRDRLSLHIPAGGRIQFSDSLQGTPTQLFASVERMNLEGIVCKRPGSTYVSGPTTNWLRVKTFTESELEILGVQHEPGKASRIAPFVNPSQGRRCAKACERDDARLSYRLGAKPNNFGRY